MMFYKNLRLLLALCLLAACGGPRAVLTPGFTRTTKMAVLPFRATGDMSSQKLGLFCRSTLSRELVLQRKAQVVDNSLTNAKLTELDITSVNLLASNQLRRLAADLGIDTLVAGELNTWPSENADLSLDMGETNFLMTVRFIEPATGLVLGIVTQKTSGKERPEVMLATMLKSIVAKIKHEKIKAADEQVTENDTQRGNGTEFLATN